jgi:membrane protease YdiL (CAAX protease family)
MERGRQEEGSRAAGLAGFLALTFALTWIAWIVPAVLAPGSTVLGVGGPIFLFGVFAPAIVAVVLTAVREGRQGVARFLSRIGRWQVAGRYYAFAVGYMAAAKMLGAVLVRTFEGAWPAFGDDSVLLMAGAMLVSTWVQAGEEVGWRGFALPRLTASLGLGGASVVLGLVWALWHLPLFYIPGGGTEGQSFFLYVAYVVAISVAMAWLYWKTGGSLLLTMIMHAAINNTTLIPLASAHAVAPLSFEASWTAWATVGVMLAVAGILLVRMRGACEVEKC